MEIEENNALNKQFSTMDCIFFRYIVPSVHFLCEKKYKQKKVLTACILFKLVRRLFLGVNR